jgi:hypothetical protein
VHSGLIDKKYIAILDAAFKDRQTWDYGDFLTVINNITLKNITPPD